MIRGTRTIDVPTVPTFTYGTPTPEADTIEAITESPLGFDGEPFDPAVLVWAQVFAARGRST